jgi:hypothetical protein
LLPLPFDVTPDPNAFELDTEAMPDPNALLPKDVLAVVLPLGWLPNELEANGLLLPKLEVDFDPKPPPDVPAGAGEGVPQPPKDIDLPS